MADKLELTVQINANTGQLEVVGQKIEGLGQKTKGLAGEAANLAKSFLPFATAGGIVAFFTNAVKGAEEENQALQRLKFSVEALGQSWEKNRKAVLDWGAAIQATTRFSDTEAFEAVGKLTRVTGDLAQAQAASRLAMSLSVVSGKDLGVSIDLITNLINKNERSIKEANREFGAFTDGARTTQGVLDALTKNLGDAAFKEENLTKSTHSLKNAFGDFSEEVGRAVIPALTSIFNMATSAMRRFEQFGLIIGSFAAKVTTVLTHNVGEGISLKEKLKVISDETEAQFIEMEERITKKTVEKSAERVRVKQQASEQEIRMAEDQASKIQAIEAQIAQNLAALEQNDYQRKKQVLDAEIAARRQKIMREITDERQKSILLSRLDQEHLARQQFMAKAEVQIKQAVALETADTAIQALAVVNDMSKKDTEGQVIRAKAILALEKSIAIARILSSPQAVLNPGLAAAQIALTVAQFGQQLHAIDSARNAFQQSSNQIASQSVPLPGGGQLTTFGGGGGGFNFGGGGGGGGGPSGPSSSGAGFVINIAAGAIVVNGSVGVDDIASRIGEKIIEQIKGQGQLSMTREG